MFEEGAEQSLVGVLAAILFIRKLVAAKGVGSLIDCRLNSTARGGIPNGRQAAVNAHNFLFQLHETKTEAASLCKSGGYHRFMCLHATTTRGSFGARVP